MGIAPKEWKDAGAGEEQVQYCLYHIQGSGTTAGAKKIFFATDEATSGIAVTNMSIAGQLPSTQRMLVKEIRVSMDPIAAGTDVNKVLDAAILDLYVGTDRMLTIPLIECLSPSYIIPAGVTQAVDHAAGQGFKLERYIMIPGGVNFKVEVTVGKTAPSADTDIYVELHGDLVRLA